MNLVNEKNSILIKLQKINSFWLYFIPFVLLSAPVVIQILTDNLPEVNGYYSMHYVINYSHGYIARGLVGEILSWFFDVLTSRILNICNVIFTEILVIAASLCIGKALDKSRKNENIFFAVFFLLLFLCLAEFTVGTYYTDIKIDKLLWALTLFSVYFSDNKILKYFIPVLSVICVFINPVYCFTGFVLVAIVLFDKFQKNSYSFKFGFILISTCAFVLLVTAVAPAAQSHINFKDANEFLDYYFARLDSTLSQDLRTRFADEWIIEYFIDSPKTLLKETFNIYFVNWNNGAKTILSTLFLAIPSFAVASAFWVQAFKKDSDKFRKFIYFICTISYLAIIPAIVLSWEATKYYGNYLLVQTALIVYFLIHNDESCIYVVDKLKNKTKEFPLAVGSILGYFITALMVVSK